MKQRAETNMDLAADPEGRRGARFIAQMPRKIVFAAAVDTFRLDKLHGTLCLTTLVSMGIRAFSRAGVLITGQAASLCAGSVLFRTFWAFCALLHRLMIRCALDHGACGG